MGLSKYHYEKNQQKLTHGILKNYKTTEGYLVKFLKKEFKEADVPLRYIEYKLILDFVIFLLDKDNHMSKNQPLTINGVMKHLERLMKLLNYTVKLGWIKSNPLEKYQLKFKRFGNGFLTAVPIETIGRG